MRYRKHSLAGIFIILMIMVLSGCSKSGKAEKEILKDLQANPAFIAANVEISDYEIIKRQTDVNNKTDLVYITVYTNDPELTCSLSYKLEYELYNEGWLLESVNRSDGPWEISGPKEDQLISDIKDYDFYFSDWDLFVQDIEIVDEGYNSNAITDYEKWLTVNLIADNLWFDYYATYNVFYEIADGDWKLQNIDIQSTNYTPTYSVDISASDKIMETLEMDLHLGDGIVYDSFEYLRTDEDWDNCLETRYYTATKSWFYGTETFMIGIPLHFYLADGDTHWSYNSNEISHTLQSVDWNIAYEWICNYSGHHDWGDALNGYAVAQLRIYGVFATDDPTVYIVNLYCDAYSTNYGYRCYTDIGVPGELSYNGYYWTLSINEPNNIDPEISWRGSFSFYGYEYLNRQGVYWNCIVDGVKLEQVQAF